MRDKEIQWYPRFVAAIILAVEKIDRQYKVMRTTAQGNMPLCGCGWRDTHGRFHLS